MPLTSYRYNIVDVDRGRPVGVARLPARATCGTSRRDDATRTSSNYRRRRGRTRGVSTPAPIGSIPTARSPIRLDRVTSRTRPPMKAGECVY